MSKHLKIFITVFAVICIISGICISQVYKYHINNSWAGIVVFDGEENTDLNKTPEYPDDFYLQGEMLPVSFADVEVKKVGYPGGVTLSSKADIIYNGKTYHKVTVEDGTSCIIKKGDDSVTVAMYNCAYR